MPGNDQQVYLEPEPWTGTIMDMTWTGYVTIWCFEEPITPWIVKCGSESITIPQTLSCNNGEGSFIVGNISAIGRYVVGGNCWVELTGGNGGTIYISGGL